MVKHTKEECHVAWNAILFDPGEPNYYTKKQLYNTVRKLTQDGGVGLNGPQLQICSVSSPLPDEPKLSGTLTCYFPYLYTL